MSLNYAPGKVLKMPILSGIQTWGSPVREQRYDNAWYDYQTMTWKTASQEAQIMELREQLETKKQAEREKVKSIIGYFYKRR